MTVSRRSTLAAIGVLLTLSAGCGSASEPSPPSGVDELVIPTPDPRPGDFVSAIDNPWLPYAVGSTWTYAAGSGSSLVVTVDNGPKVDGIATTAVTSTVTAPPGETKETVDYYAQDRRGNVWWFGREGAWVAGEGGEEAGLAMAATPRLGDGYALGNGAHAEVVDLDGYVSVPAGEYDAALVIEVTQGIASATRRYAGGVGLVENEAGGGLQLVNFDR